MLENGRTSSRYYRINSVVACQQSAKSSSSSKLVVRRDGGATKRYDFEAEGPKAVSKIVQNVRSIETAVANRGQAPSV